MLQQALGDQYALERELGRGGMGAVFLARDLRLHRSVAIKVLPPELSAHADLRERFLRETRVAASFSHPNIVPVHAIEEREGLLAFVMGFVDGETLGARVRRAGPMTVPDAVRVLQEVAWALSYAHGRGVVHRDVKPDNILLERASGRAMVTDFGIARSVGAAAPGDGLTRVGEVVGTPQFMSPEQASGDVVDGRSDLYSLGVVAFYALSGRLPFDNTSPTALLAMHLTQPPPSLSAIRPDLPGEVIDAVERCLAKHPDDRWASGEALASALDVMRTSAPEIAPAVRVFLQRVGAAATAFLVLAVVAWMVIRDGMGNGESQDWILVATVVFAAMWGLAVQATARVRMLVRQGFRYRDVTAAAVAIRAEEAAARDAIKASDEEMRRRRKRIVIGIASLTWAPLAMWWVTTTMRTPIAGRPGAYSVSIPGALIAFSAAIAFGLGLTLLASDPLKPSPMVVLQSLFWRGPLGRALFAVGAWRMRGASDTSSAFDTGARVTTGGARTVLVTLPKALQRGLRGIEGRLLQIETEIAALGRREEELTAAASEAGIGGTGSDLASLGARRADVARELAGHVTQVRGERERRIVQLESVRLELLRLRAGVGSPDAVHRALDPVSSAAPLL